jgi:hypothetical protein
MSSSRPFWLLGASVLVPTMVSAAQNGPSPSLSDQQFAPPQSPMLFTRTLRRSLPGGGEVVTRRSYRIRFIRDANGFRIEGALLACEVDAPPALSGLAAIERARGDDGMFPLRVDLSGRLQPAVVAEARAAPVELRTAVSTAVRQLADAPLAPAERGTLRSFAQNIGERPAVSQWPVNLFHPGSGQAQETRTVRLPNGESGQVTIAIEAQAHPQGGMLRTMTRTVTTDLDGTARTSLEQWTLLPEVES